MTILANKEVIKDLFDDYFAWRQMDNPEYSTHIGFYKYEDQISDWTEEAFVSTLVISIHFP